MNVLFGTDGIRGKVGYSIFTESELLRLGRAIAYWIRHTFKNHKILFIQDTRESGVWIKSLLSASLISAGITIYDGGILPTPASGMLLPLIECEIAIVITASHNPYTDNGIKIITRDGKLSETDEKLITHYYLNSSVMTSSFYGAYVFSYELQERYRDEVLSLFKPFFLTGTKIVLDQAHGATSGIATKIFSTLGAHVISINSEPNGKNINESCGAVHPENLRKTVLDHKADLGCAFDGDGDRLVCINRWGEIKNGDDFLALLSTHPRYQSQQEVVSTIMSNEGLSEYLTCRQKLLKRVAVGDKYVFAAMQTNNILLGAEPSGHIILRDINRYGDAIIASLTILEELIRSHNWDFNTFNKFPQRLLNFSYKNKSSIDEQALDELIGAARERIGNGRIIVRWSGTEPLLRIMAEAPSFAVLEEVIGTLNAAVPQLLYQKESV
jgi:phosphoglucosamine mutase